MLKNPVAMDNQGKVEEKNPRVYRPKGLEGTARFDKRARLAPLLKLEGGAPIRDIQERPFVMDEHKISQLFAGYFNNKMTLLLFLIQAKHVKPHSKLAETIHFFLEDLFHHMLEDRLQRQTRLTFKWLKRFFEKLPDVRVDQRDKAKDFIRAIYDAFGMHLKDDI